MTVFSLARLSKRAARVVGLLLGALSIGLAQHALTCDTLTVGVVYSKYGLPGPVLANVIAIDLGDSTVMLRAFQLPGLVRTSDQARALADSGVVVLAAINADFFSFESGWPVDNTVIDGAMVLGVRSRRSHLVISGAARPYIERLTFVGIVRTSRGDAVTLGSVNSPSPTVEQTRLYTPAYGSDTGNDSSGVKIVLERIRAAQSVHDTAWYVITGRVPLGRAAIPSSGGVLAVPEDVLVRTGGGFLVGDTISILADLVPYVPDIRQVVGGAGRILTNGLCDTVDNHARENLSLAFQSDLHPRTFVAFDRDTTRLFLCAVDGRQDKSKGVNFPEMAEFLRSLGAWNAVNLDGGGSTTMVVRGTIVNHPSDKTGERPVANILAVTKRTR